ncbi:unnamed protein product [Hermetia illucens]|uniref:Uncharacterized protein n=1 Tax=Hermetia illucens TaxID=343691 RepID=A0A7R8V731_HERIL|nr:uncharacterized protein LOC119660989 isoform X2 [Hermetia illucens]XP_037926005.1 uncharacterized protein LOC119660989 isoform X2 [Hermetia illucens]CAD7094073.1 unnamed protein product [Hermetia illucens]
MLRERRRHANYKPNRRLDRKSSRGMIYENEELRLRTININAEVERGQSDIRKLRRENEQLKREIWSLRDEYERINKKMCSNRNCSSCEHISNSDSQSEDSEYCEACRESEPRASSFDSTCQHRDEQEKQDKGNLSIHSTQVPSAGLAGSTSFGANSSKEIAENYENAQKTLAQPNAPAAATSSPTPPTSSSGSLSTFVPAASTASGPPPTMTLSSKHNCKVPPSVDSVSSKLRENLHVNFGQLSVLSEENLTNSDGASSVNGDQDANMTQLNKLGESSVSPLREIQSILPPLSHFENIPYEPITTSSLDKAADTLSPAMSDDHHLITNEWSFPTQQAADRDKFTDPNKDERNAEPAKIAPMQQFHSPKHFFSPINPRLIKPPPPSSSTPPIAPPMFANPPDLFVANALASPCHRPVITANQTMETSVYPAPSLPLPPPPVQMPPVVPVPYSSDSSFYDGNLEDLLLEIETLQIQLEKHKSYSQEKLPTNEPFSTRKPYRSEMNLVVSCNGCKSSITPIAKQTSASLSTGFDYKSDYFPNNSLMMDTPPPNIPQPMILFPQNLTYLARDTYDHGGSVPILNDITEYPIRPPTSAMVDLGRTNIKTGAPGLPMTALNVIDGAPLSCEEPIATTLAPTSSATPPIPGVGASVNLGGTSMQTGENSLKDTTELSGSGTKLETKKSPAAIRRKLFSGLREDSKSGSTSETNVGGMDKLPERADSNASDNLQNDSSSGSDTTKRKAPRRISITFSDTRKYDEEKNEKYCDRKTEENTLSNKVTTSQIGTSLTSDLQKSHKAPCDLITQSTPNSPHFGARRTSNAGHSHHHHHHHHHGATTHHCTRKLSEESMKYPRKCSRRYSEGTVDTLPAHSSFGSAYSGASGAGASAIVAMDGRRQGSSNFHEVGTSVSERNSNSFASSRESSTSQSTHSQRRKISVSSHNGGKIPWCGCWGNGCL